MLVQGASVDLGASIERTYNPMIRTLQACEFPTIAQVHGVAAGAGSSFALACDLVYAARSAYFVQAFVRIGLAPDAGGSWQLVHRAGLARAMGMAMLGQRIGAPLAAEWGLIWSCVEDDALESSVTGAAHELATLPAEALRAIKSLLRNASHHSLDEQLNQERDAQRLLGCTPDFREGVTAFLARRTPRYGGKLHQ
jgi:2-(1,2-epoxy-1,2-dihydrophenyl)acetyl-CoA isomerase